jgi:pantoate--beta-alanine ligase
VELIREADEVRGTADAWRSVGLEVGLVPTMGALHAGHEALIRRARDGADRTLVSIFVNPAQFGPSEDLAMYPRDEERDLEVCRDLEVDGVWIPTEEEVYPPGLAVAQPDPGPVGETFEGAARPGHFRGVLKVVHRLFDLAGPCRAYFGEKDVQQLFLVRRMVRELGMPIEVVGCPTVREVDGLAWSSRNRLLAPEEREQAGCLFLALAEAAALARGGERDPAVLIAAMAREVGATPLARLEYAAVVDDESFLPQTVVEPPARAIIAARFPSARLIDNVSLAV